MGASNVYPAKAQSACCSGPNAAKDIYLLACGIYRDVPILPCRLGSLLGC